MIIFLLKTHYVIHVANNRKYQGNILPVINAGFASHSKSCNVTQTILREQVAKW